MRIQCFITFVLLLLGSSLSAAAQSAGRSEDPWLEELSYQLSQHFLPDGQLALEWTRARPVEAGEPADLVILSYPSALSPQLIVRIRATGAKGTSEHSLVLRAQLWRDGWAIREPSNRGEPVSVSMLEPMRFDALREREAVVGLEDLDVIYSRNVSTGRLLTWRDVSRRPLVRRGQMIEVAASEGSLTVTLRAVALADAARGEVVRVRNPDSRREFSAQVVADGRAQVRF